MSDDSSPGGPPKISKDRRNLGRVLAHHGISLVFDVGANVGQYGRRLREAGYGGRIVSFEPASGPHAALLAEAAGDTAWIVPEPLALGATPGTVPLNLSPASDMNSTLPFTREMERLLDDAAFTRTEIVRQTTLDAVFDDYAQVRDRVLLKVDTQGTEMAVLEGAEGNLPRIDLIQIELSIVPVYEGEPDYRITIAALEALGFAPVLFVPGYFNRRTARLIGMDGVFARIR